MDDLKCKPKDPVVEKPVEVKPILAQTAMQLPEGIPAEPEGLPPEREPSAASCPGRPHRAARSHRQRQVTFSDGKGADWPSTTGAARCRAAREGYKPTQKCDGFQTELQSALAKMGF